MQSVLANGKNIKISMHVLHGRPAIFPPYKVLFLQPR